MLISSWTLPLRLGRSGLELLGLEDGHEDVTDQDDVGDQDGRDRRAGRITLLKDSTEGAKVCGDRQDG